MGVRCFGENRFIGAKNMKVNIISDDKLTVPELAAFAGVCSHTVVRWMDKKGLPFVRVGKQRMTTVQVFEEWTRRDSQDD